MVRKILNKLLNFEIGLIKFFENLGKLKRNFVINLRKPLKKFTNFEGILSKIFGSFL